jgi:hypothetical protein
MRNNATQQLNLYQQMIAVVPTHLKLPSLIRECQVGLGLDTQSPLTSPRIRRDSSKSGSPSANFREFDR